VKLEAQELRNAVARGNFNDLTKTLAALPSFRQLIQVDVRNPELSVKVQKMEDTELVLRFFALRGDRHNALRKGFKEFLTTSLHEFNEEDEDFIDQCAHEFEVYMDFLFDTFGPSAFSKFKIEGENLKKMSSFNAAVYDAVAVGLANTFSADDVSNNPKSVAKKMAGFQRALFSNTDFFSAVSGSVNDASKVVTRIDAMVTYLNR
jgi:hypothetical protein